MVRRSLVIAVTMLTACPKEDAPVPSTPRDGRLGKQSCTGQPALTAQKLPVFQRPFDGHYPVANLFDHDVPVVDVYRLVDNEHERELTYCGIEALGRARGYPGYSFKLPEGTPVLAPADGIVSFAGVMPPFVCPLTMKLVEDQRLVELRHPSLGGVGFVTRYLHFAALTVKMGDHVVAGQRLGTSGKSGCTSGPLLYFEVRRLLGTKTKLPTVVDPYGWDGPSPDPWAQHEQGAESVYLWKSGEAPTLSSR